MSKTIKRLSAILALIIAVISAICVLFTFSTAHANSAPKRWYGSNGIGAIVDEACPLEVEHENLDFFVTEYPKHFYDSENELLSYSGRVTAEYTFYNPTYYDVTATLMFPFGELPSYAYGDFDESKLLDKNEITIDGESVEKKLRHSFSQYSFEYVSENNVFDTQTELDRLADEPISTDFYTPDTRVTIYGYQVRDLIGNGNGIPRAVASISVDSRTRIMAGEADYYETENDGLSISWFVDNGDTNTIVAIGAPLDTLPQWKIYYNGTRTEVENGYMEFVNTRTCSLYDYVMEYYDDTKSISRTDFYNAAIAVLECSNSGYVGDNKTVFVNNDRYLMRWFEYELTVPAGGRVKNSVTAPIYPYIDGTGKYDVFGYTYLLSPASCWKCFGTLDITVHTDDYIVYIVNDNVELEKSDGAYTASLDGLPNGELEFYICSEQIEYPYKGSVIWTVIIVAGLIVVGLTGAGVIVAPIIILSVYFTQQKKLKKSQ